MLRHFAFAALIAVVTDPSLAKSHRGGTPARAGGRESVFGPQLLPFAPIPMADLPATGRAVQLTLSQSITFGTIPRTVRNACAFDRTRKTVTCTGTVSSQPPGTGPFRTPLDMDLKFTDPKELMVIAVQLVSPLKFYAPRPLADGGNAGGTAGLSQYCKIVVPAPSLAEQWLVCAPLPKAETGSLNIGIIVSQRDAAGALLETPIFIDPQVKNTGEALTETSPRRP